MATLAELRNIANNSSMTEASANSTQHKTSAKDVLQIAGFSAMCIVGGMIIVPLLILGAIISPITSKLEKAKTRYTSSEFNTLISQMESLQAELLKRQKSSKYYNLVYRYHKNESFGEVRNKKFQKVDIKQAFESGSAVRPELFVLYFSSDALVDPNHVYKKLVDAGPTDDTEQEDYYNDIQSGVGTEMDNHLTALGFSSDKSWKYTSNKYPLVKLGYRNDGDGSWITIEPIVECPIGKADSKKSSLSDLRKISKK